MSDRNRPVLLNDGGQPTQGPPPTPPVPPGPAMPPRPAAPPTAALIKVGFWTRFAAAIVDLIVVGIPCWIIVAVAGAGAVMGGGRGGPSPAGMAGFGVAQMLILIISLAYSIGLIGSRGQTVGMMALKIKVVPTTGGEMTYGRATLRWVGSILSGAIVYLGYLWIAWDPDKQAWHDKIANTYVVKV